MSRNPLLVKTARIKLSQPQSVEVGLSNGQVVKIAGEAARESINAIALAKQSPNHPSTVGLPQKGGDVVLVAVDGKNLDATFND